jgi:16S rRNA (cytosine967-C5)-methyltransferase
MHFRHSDAESARYLKSGGTMVFSTCTTRREENEEVLAPFLDAHPEMSKVPFSDGLCEYKDGVCRTFAHRDGCDGFFIAKLQKN